MYTTPPPTKALEFLTWMEFCGVENEEFGSYSKQYKKNAFMKKKSKKLWDLFYKSN